MNVEKIPRDLRLDALRGFFLIAMVGVHIPSPISRFFQDFLGTSGAAEGFIFLSAFLAGLVYGNIYLHKGFTSMVHRLYQRVKLIYTLHLLVLFFVMSIVWAFSNELPPLQNHFSYFLAAPALSIALSPFLLHQPPLFDILPLYIIFLAFTPLLFWIAQRKGWLPLILLSFLIWFLTQWKFDKMILYPLSHSWTICLGSFNLFAWQLLWLLGLALGESSLHHPLIEKKYRPYVAIPSLLIVSSGIALHHHLLPQNVWNDDLFLLMNKWRLGPLRLFDFIAWALFLIAWNPSPPRFFQLPLALLGRHSLAVFVLHLPLVIIVTTIIQMVPLSYLLQNGLTLIVFALLFLFAFSLEEKKLKDCLHH